MSSRLFPTPKLSVFLLLDTRACPVVGASDADLLILDMEHEGENINTTLHVLRHPTQISIHSLAYNAIMHRKQGS